MNPVDCDTSRSHFGATLVFGCQRLLQSGIGSAPRREWVATPRYPGTRAAHREGHVRMENKDKGNRPARAAPQGREGAGRGRPPGRRGAVRPGRRRRENDSGQCGALPTPSLSREHIRLLRTRFHESFAAGRDTPPPKTELPSSACPTDPVYGPSGPSRHKNWSTSIVQRRGPNKP